MQNLEDILTEFYKVIGAKYPNINLELYYRTDSKILNLAKIIVPKQDQNQGIGTKVLTDIARLADNLGYTVILTPDTRFGASSVSRLQKFYKGFGFVINTGKNKDYTLPWCGMYRLPK